MPRFAPTWQLPTGIWETPIHGVTEFNEALTYTPDNPNTLFHLGLVKWQGKQDSAGAIAVWKKLLATNPDYKERDKVQRMLAEVNRPPNPARGSFRLPPGCPSKSALHG